MSLLTFSICSCMLSTFSIRAISLLIMHILNSLFHSSKFCVRVESFSDPCFISSDRAFIAFYYALWFPIESWT